MSYVLVDAVLLTSGIPHIPKMVLIALARHAGDDGRHARPGHERIEEMMDMSTRSVIYGLRYLKEHHFITPTAHAQGGRGLAAEYRISVERVHAMHGLEDEKGARRARFAQIKGARGAQKGAPRAPQSVMNQSSDQKFDLNGDDPSTRARAHPRARDDLPDVQNPDHWEAFYAWSDSTVGQKYLAAQYATKLPEPMQFACYRTWWQKHPEAHQEEEPSCDTSPAADRSAGARTPTAAGSASMSSSPTKASGVPAVVRASRPA